MAVPSQANPKEMEEARIPKEGVCVCVGGSWRDEAASALDSGDVQTLVA